MHPRPSGGRGNLHRRGRCNPAGIGGDGSVVAAAHQPAGRAVRGPADGKPVPGVRAGGAVGLSVRPAGDADRERCSRAATRFLHRDRRHRAGRRHRCAGQGIGRAAAGIRVSGGGAGDAVPAQCFATSIRGSGADQPAEPGIRLRRHREAFRRTRHGFRVPRCARPGTTSEERDSGFSAARNPGMANEKGGAGEGPTTDSDSLLPQAGQGKKSFDKRIGWLFVITLFVPAILGFAWLLRAALRPASWAGRTFTLGQRLLTEPRVLVDYLHWTLLPDPGTLSLYHDEIVTSTGLFTPWTTLPSIALLAALIAIAVWLRNRLPLVALGIGWFFASQLLTATIVPLELVYEQRMYFGSIGVLLAVFSLLLGLRNRIRLPLARGTVIALLLLLYASVTYLRAQEWSNPLRLAIAEANRHPTSARANYEAGR